MAHYAFLDKNNVVTEVIVGKNEGEDGKSGEEWEAHYGAFRGQPCKRTSYHTIGGVHSAGGVAYRKNYAGIGYTYDVERDAFIPPRLFASWVLNEQSCLWEPPVPKPSSANAEIQYTWNENDQQWVEVTNGA